MPKKECPVCKKTYDKKGKSAKGNDEYFHRNEPNEYMPGSISYNVCVDRNRGQ